MGNIPTSADKETNICHQQICEYRYSIKDYITVIEDDIIEDCIELCRDIIYDMIDEIDVLTQLSNSVICKKKNLLKRIKWLHYRKRWLRSNLEVHKKLTIIDEINKKMRLWNLN